MPIDLSEADIEMALQACADEPVHSPGMIQPFGWLVAYDVDTGSIRYLSENVPSLLGAPAKELLGQSLRDVFGAEIWHAVQNALASKNIADRRIRAGKCRVLETACELSVFKSGEHVVIELEAVDDVTGLSPEALHELGFLIDTIQACQSQAILLETTARLVKIFSGYDRVMVYRFDRDFNGEILAEAKKSSLEPMLGTRFPHWDIPAQARAIMRKVPLRLISDIEQEPVPILAAGPDCPDLDITHAYIRGVSPVHLQYLRNMGSRATMTLSVVVDERLWGIISLHHSRVRVPSPQIRYVLQEFLKAFQLKLHLLQESALLKTSNALESINALVHDQIQPDISTEQLVVDIGPRILELVSAQGIALLMDSQSSHLGQIPGKAVLDRLANDVRDEHDGSLVIDHLADRYPHLSRDLNGCAGALVITYPDNLGLFAFRQEMSQSIHWAGNPEKMIESVDGSKRLAPRGSFSTYLQMVVGRSEPWSDQDIHLFRQLWTLLSVAGQTHLLKLNRQRALMIDELNHRVRNILALVRAVSKQARTHYGSLESYSKALEARIYSLAAVHDIGSGSAETTISIKRIIRQELEPYEGTGSDRIVITGTDRSIRADMGPLFALVIHEMTTNAAKYGALSTTEGRVEVDLALDAESLCITWKECDGPAVEEPTCRGFGTTLIEQAVPYELGGSSTITFERSGVRANIQLPADLLDGLTGVPTDLVARALDAESVLAIPSSKLGAHILIVEDNFMIATDMRTELERLGFDNIELSSNVVEALDSIAHKHPDLAFLDVNLGGGRTSEEVAMKLLALSVPFVFVTGYGERTRLIDPLNGVMKLTKPVSEVDIQRAVMSLLNQKEKSCVH